MLKLLQYKSITSVTPLVEFHSIMQEACLKAAGICFYCLFHPCLVNLPPPPLKLNCSSYLSAFFNCTPVCFLLLLLKSFFSPRYWTFFCFDCCLHETDQFYRTTLCCRLLNTITAAVVRLKVCLKVSTDHLDCSYYCCYRPLFH